jgi:alkanesulfonate monooxygenase SsuD/methylene tetrahydromethanopterin reductase-like flavin-dependent oxidoreductase (luciferase family)
MARDIGLIFSFRNPDFHRVPWPELYRSELDLMVAAEDLTYDTVWLTEHHFVDDGYSPSLFPIAAAAAARTSRIRIGTYVLLLPLHNPVRVAEDAITVDIISNGRFDLGMGLGYRPGEFDPQGISHHERGARMDEHLPLVQRLMADENVSFDGRFNHLKDITVTPRPVQRPHPPIWVGARGEKALDRAARLGFHLASVGTPQHRVKYLEALKRHGRNPADFNVCQLVVGYVAETRQQAWDEAAQPLYHVLKYYHDWAVESGDITGDVEGMAVPSAEEMRRKQAGYFFTEPAFIGTPDEVYEGIKSYLERSPSTHLAIMMSLPGNDPKNTRRSMELFAREVMPRLRRLTSQQAA